MQETLDELVAIGWGIMILLVLMIALAMIFRPKKKAEPDYVSMIVAAIDQATENLSQSVQHYTHVNAVLALTETFTDQPELLDRLSGYSKQVVAAALMYRVNELGEDLRVAQDSLSYAERYPHYAVTIKARRASVDRLITELQEANTAVQEFKGRLSIA